MDSMWNLDPLFSRRRVRMKDLGSKYDSVGRHGEEPIVSVDMFHGTSLCEIVAILLQEVLPIHLHSDCRVAERLLSP